jgi:hypothetical protein
MKLLKAAPAILCAAAMTSIFLPVASAQFEQGDYNRKTTVTFSAPVEIPGVHLKGFKVLPAGTYVFKLVDSQVNRHIVQIQSADEKKTYATIMAIPNMRVKRVDQTVITFRERPNGEPPALRAWFYPTDAWGEEFVYGKKEAKELAASNNTPVLYTPDENQQAEVEEPIQTPTPAAVQQMNQAPVMAYNSTGDDVDLSQAVTAPPANNTATQNNTVADATPAPSAVTPPPPSAAPAPIPSSTPTELPQTGSPFGAMMLSGLLALGGGFGLRAVLQRCL